MSPIPDTIKRFTDPRPAQAHSHAARNGAILIVVTAFLTFCAVTGNIPFIGGVPGEPVRAEFTSANQVNGQTPVRVDGVDVGKVEKIEAGSQPRRTSMVTLRITDEDVTVRRDASAEVRWKTLLGGAMYIDLHPGSPSAPPIEDRVIPTERTSSQVEVDDLLQPYDGTTEQAQRGTLKGLAEGLGDPRGTGRTIETLPALETVERGMEPLRGQTRDDLRRLVESTGETVDALGADTASLQALVTGANRTLAATQRRRAELGELIELSPSTLDETSVTMTRLRTTLDHLDPLVAELRPGVRELAPAANAANPALDQADALLDELRPVLRDARPAFASLERASDAGVPLLRGLDPVVRRVDAEVLPFLAMRDDENKLRTFEAIGPAFSAAAMAGAEFDDNGHRFRLTVPAANNSAVALKESNFATSCRQSVSGARADGCAPLAHVLAQGWFGRGPRR